VPYAATALEKLGKALSPVDCGVDCARGGSGACLWLSVCAAASRVPNFCAGLPGAAAAALGADALAHLAAAPAQALSRGSRATAEDTLGTLAADLRELACAWMLGPDGLDIFLGAYAPSREGDQRSYCDFIRDTADWEYADEHHLRALAMLLAVRVVVVPRYADRAVQVHGAAPPERTIYLGNDDVHYVWLADPLPLSPGSLGAPAVVDLLKDSESGVEELPGRGRVPRSKKPPARKACQKSVAKKAVEKPPNGGRFRRGTRLARPPASGGRCGSTAGPAGSAIPTTTPGTGGRTGTAQPAACIRRRAAGEGNCAPSGLRDRSAGVPRPRVSFSAMALG
jgi:hypothetical protein